MSDGRDIVVIGGGVIGLAAAREAAGVGLRVTVLERDPAPVGASWAAAGMLSPLDEANGAGPFLDFAVASLRLYRDWSAQVEEESGCEIGYSEAGKLLVAFSEAGSEELRNKLEVAADAGIAAEWIDVADVTRDEPAITAGNLGGLLIHDDFHVDNRRLTSALAECCHRRGVEIRTGAAVRAVRGERGRVTGVDLSNGESLTAETVLVAAGAWSGRLEGLPRPLPIRPIRGQMLALRPASPISSRVLGSSRVYLVPRDDGRLLVGATVEDVGFVEANTVGGTRRLLGGAIELVPDLEIAPIVESWSGFRPASDDGDPIIGPDPALKGLLYATGHFRNGILLAPATARVVAALLTRGETDLLPREFGCERLHDGAAGSVDTTIGPP